MQKVENTNLLRVTQKVDISDIIAGIKGYIMVTPPSLREVIDMELRISKIKTKMNNSKDDDETATVAYELLSEFEAFFNRNILEIMVETKEGLQSVSISHIMDLNQNTITAFWTVVKEGSSPKAPQV